MKSQFGNWILSKSAELKLRFENLTWIQDFLPGHHDIAAYIQIDGVEYSGRGHHQNRDQALIIATSEAIERCICLEQLETTNGVAAHTDIELAQQNARNELVERDLFFSHFLTNTPFQLISNAQLDIPLQISKFLFKSDCNINFYKMRECNLGTGIVCLISNGSSWGCILGLAFGQDHIQNLSKKAMLESFRQYIHIFNSNSFGKNHSINEFLQLKKWSLADHHLLSMNSKYFQMISNLFPTEEHTPVNDNAVTYNLTHFNFSLIKSRHLIFADCPLFVSYCTEPHSQKLNVGSWNDKNISYSALERFGSQLDLEKFNLPHPIN